jgi:protein SCO1/2
MMERRDFLGLALAPLLLAAPAYAAKAPQRSAAARSGFMPNVPVVTHTGRRVRFYDDLVRDRIVMLNMFLVECTDGQCPTATATLRKVQDLLGERMGRDIFFYSITLTPKNDTPQVLRDYAANFDVQPGWSFLTGTPANIERLRQGLGFVDSDPERDKDVMQHVGMARYGDDRLNRWGGVALNSSPENIASTFKWLST